MKWVAFVIPWLFLYVEATNFQPKLHIVTVATNEDNDGLKRLKHSAELYGHELHIFGLDEEWKGGDMQNSQGGAQKIRILREGLSEFKEKNDAILMFVDAYDVIINADPDIILRRFLQEFPEYRVVFSAEPFCWPDKNLASKYPVITFGERYLNSGMFMGYAQDVLKILEHGKGLKDNDDDQRFYTSIYLNKELRDTYKISLDSLSRIFQNLNGLTEDVHIDYDLDGNAQVFNSLYNTHPVVIHGNGPSKVYLNQLGNYIAHGYNEKVGCLKCKPLIEIKPEEITLYVAIFISKPIPFVEEFLATFEKIEFPKENIHLLIYNNQPLNKITIKNFIDEKIGTYKSVTALNMKKDDDEHASRDYAIEWATKNNADFLLMLDADAHLTNLNSLQLLIRKALTYNTEILAPMIAQPKKLYTNFWGAVSSTGYYARSSDYLDIVENKLRGYWNAPFVSSAVLISKRKLPQLANAYSYNKEMDADMSFSLFCRNYGQFMYVDNLDEYGFLVPSDQFSQFLKEGYTNPELYDYFDNHDLWEKRYIHPKYFHYIKPGVVVEQPCPDVYDFPFLSERFAKELIEVMEGNGQWSDGSHLDRRLEGGYENVPTRDIHMNQVNFDKQFLSIMDEYVAPMQEKVFTGYYQRPVKSNMMFVVRYKPEEQASLRPHHDASTYSIDVALNKRDVDYEGGGVRYIRYNCTVPADQVGWSMLFPGRLSHLHEGLLTTKGTRYILVSFINP